MQIRYFIQSQYYRENSPSLSPLLYLRKTRNGTSKLSVNRIFVPLIDHASALDDVFASLEELHVCIRTKMQTYAQNYSREIIGMQAISTVQLSRSNSRRGWLSHCILRRCRVAGSDSGSAWANEKLSGLYIRSHGVAGVFVMQNSRANWIPPGDTSLSFMELIPARQENVWRDVRGLRSPRSRLGDEDLFLVVRYCKRNGPRDDREYVIAKLTSAFVTERTGLEFIFPG